MSIGIIILAAGGSTRLGKPKQLLIYNNKPLITHAVNSAIETQFNPVVVVTGAHHNEVIDTLVEKPVAYIHNDAWKEGMGSSIKTGLNKLLSIDKDIEKTIVMLCDQPFVNSAMLQQLDTIQLETKKDIVASFYNNTAGVPALFSKKYFDKLLALEGQEGAKKLFVDHSQDLVTIPFPLGAVDIDTEEDYMWLSTIQNNAL